MKKILLLTCGGTIAATPGPQGLQPTTTGQAMLQLLPELQGRCQIEVRQAFNLDSSNMHPAEWARLAEQVYAALPAYDGIVITHGTDTMAYCLAALSFMLPGLSKPVVFTGAQLPIQAAESDGPGNLRDAFTVACTGRAGVMLVFAGRIIHGCRAKKLDSQQADTFHSVNTPQLGQVAGGNVSWLQTAPTTSSPCQLKTACEEAVLLLKLAPGLRPDMIEAATALGYRGIVVEAYGIGNLPDAAPYDLESALIQAMAKGVLVAVGSQCPYGASDLTVYGPGARLPQAGALPAYDMTTEALYAKLCWALGQTNSKGEARRLMAANLAGEMTLE